MSFHDHEHEIPEAAIPPLAHIDGSVVSPEILERDHEDVENARAVILFDKKFDDPATPLADLVALLEFAKTYNRTGVIDDARFQKYAAIVQSREITESYITRIGNAANSALVKVVIGSAKQSHGTVPPLITKEQLEEVESAAIVRNHELGIRETNLISPSQSKNWSPSDILDSIPSYGRDGRERAANDRLDKE